MDTKLYVITMQGRNKAVESLVIMISCKIFCRQGIVIQNVANLMFGGVI